MGSSYGIMGYGWQLRTGEYLFYVNFRLAFIPGAALAQYRLEEKARTFPL